ncbi:uncharacterized protein B0I36DRAFT_353644 [Microdochium trichocladiopsis]|uniref:N-acetyltransferase domain-containing protein n=1 Tax=Microdochium trichocladiopsis TaxID=1682393 RepID=A0A9P9BK71_9PEZI|nr:uncharacterized protein B0I36DRAFT_353644 [Microdochium trichocladiopsis]KAH7020909.1 hypothetical protein B0I36DRAFT_353644 [Microdochium trichocladiopsis]
MAFIRGYRESDKEDCGFICRETLPPSLSPAQASSRVQLLAPYVWTHQFTYLSPETCHVLDDGSGRAVGYCIGCPDVHALTRVYGRFVDDVLLREDEGVVVVVTSSRRPPDQDGEEEEERMAWVNGARVPWMVEVDDDAAAAAAAAADGEGRNKGAWTEDGKESKDEKQKKKTRMVTNPKALEQLAFRPDLLLAHPTFSKPTLDQQQQHPPLPSYRATMHIDLLPGYQGQGWGRKLIDTFVESVVRAASAAAAGSSHRQIDEEEEEKEDSSARGRRDNRPDYGSGIWIGVSPENRKVLPFYARVGFRLVMNDDAEGVVLVRDIPPLPPSAAPAAAAVPAPV